MLFARRDKLSFSQRLKTWMWPQRGWRRSCSYVWRRVWRLDGTPHTIALGFASGVFASFTPFMGLHFLIGFGVAWVLRGNLLASALGTFVGNPLTFPFIWWAALTLGNRILGENVEAIDMDSINLFSVSPLDLWPVIKPILFPMVIGGIPIGLCIGVISYGLIRPAINGYQMRRLEKIGNNDNDKDIAA